MASKYPIAEKFLNKFVAELINNFSEDKNLINYEHLQKNKNNEEVKVPDNRVRIVEKTYPKIPANYNPYVKKNILPNVTQRNMASKDHSQQTYMNLGKLTVLLRDPRVESIECPGPQKEIIVRKEGIIQRTNLSLSNEEIKLIINEFASKTRIPLIEGVFKAALDNLIMTAITSEFVETRFVIYKKSPFQRLS